MSGTILISSNLIVDDIQLSDGSEMGLRPGGAALWAALGARAFWPDVTMLAGVGEDFDEVFGDIVATNGLRPEAHVVRDAHTIRSRLSYAAEDDRTERPDFGPDHFERMQVTVAEAPAVLLPAAGTYVFRDLWPNFWADLAARRSTLGTIFWELQGDAARADLWDDIAALLPLVDIFSLNLAEAEAIFGAVAPEEVVARLQEEGAATVVLRMGADGAIAADASRAIMVSPAEGPVTDVTGGGNSFCGGFLAGFVATGGDLDAAARAGAASAARAIAQYGPPPPAEPGEAERLAATAAVRDLQGMGQ
ncbi:carbohydrate kinase family protein [Pelagovum pacificum]|uniref:Carbohydrate kinase PfkB domain-containing protein n=1 Tax=Pelagovum pacificum TaxID=2588711 RepID=A0A5C5GAP5_9RHOB|nr:PfkB family carbohydrate kinase [Pelagovum pacificum]QQA41769.1 hypothetical protein I8N54_13230 [Pelagovum pacificum]TNY31042.1 hypothetical protein FHY64_18300 [Pelagovum pacificum]